MTICFNKSKISLGIKHPTQPDDSNCKKSFIATSLADTVGPFEHMTEPIST